MKNYSRNKKILIICVIASVLVFTLGITYAVLVDYGKLSNVNSQLVLGDIYMHYNETNQLVLENAVPSITYDENNYFEFTIDGKNTSNKNVIYEIVLNHGDEIQNKTRLKDKFLAFKLVEVNDDTETVLFDNNIYRNINNTKIYISTIPSNTNNYLKKYRLYIRIINEVIIGNSYQDYTIEEWNDVYASIKVNIDGDFTDKELSELIKLEASDIKVKNSDTFKTYVKLLHTNTCKTYVEEDGITYISGTTYCINFNYVWYSGKLWRITAIYPDGTMKMITDDVITTISYNSSGNVNFYTDNENKSYMYQWLNEDFLDTLYNYENIIVTDSKWNSLTTTSISTKIAEGVSGVTTTTSPVGLLNSYEYYMSYKNTSSESGYLNIGYWWWLMNPKSTSGVWLVNSLGFGVSDSPTENGGRPSINLKSEIQLSGGSGTKTNPYTILGDKEEVTTGTTLLNTRSSGEYVKFNNELYRIVSIENNITKINKNDYVRDTSNNVLTKRFSTSVTYGGGTTDNHWDYYLNNTLYNSLDTSYQNMIVESTYYIGTVSDGTSYKNAVCATASNTVTTRDCTKTTSVWIGKVGLPRYGEMFASQQGSGWSLSSNMWLMNPKSTSRVWLVDSFGYGNSLGPSATSGGRPSINLKSNIKITGGKGTKYNPFEISE